ncbi:MAG TPA: hypothetical protein DEF36_02895 [Desulfotomaculum sp.]|nr:hypothetical protein [Desulfotomaculum sp.]
MANAAPKEATYKEYFRSHNIVIRDYFIKINHISASPAKQNDLYNQMLKACLQMGGQMMQNCPMLNGSNMTPEQMIKICQQMNGQMMNMSQQDITAMQQVCQQYYQQGQKSSWNTQSSKANTKNNENSWEHGNMSGNWSNMERNDW